MFDFNTFRFSLYDNPDEVIMIQNYEKNFGRLPDVIYESHFYKEYISRFCIPKGLIYNVPEAIEADFDFILLLQLGLASFSSDTNLVICDDKLEMQVCVESKELKITKNISSLSGLQVLKLFHIWTKEILRDELNIMEDKILEAHIRNERLKRIARFENMLPQILHNYEVAKFANSLNKLLEDILSKV